MLDEINAAIETAGGKWTKLRHKTDPYIDGEILAVVQRGKTFEGQPVLSRTSGQQRQEWLFTLQTTLRDDADDDGVRKFAANESAQRAIGEAVKASGQKLAIGGKLKLAVVADAPTDRDQPTFKAKYEPPAASAVSASDIFGDDEPF